MLLLGVGLLLTLSGRSAAQAPTDPSTLPLPQAAFVGVRGTTVAVRCDGTRRPGDPTVVLVSGQGVPAAAWVAPPPEELQDQVMWRPPFGPDRPVQPALAESAYTCVYDRPGLGSSGALADASPRTVADAVEDLHALLGRLSPDHPVLLVGHSMGGLIAYEYARAHRSRMAGLVLLDATHPDERQRLQWLFPYNAEREAWAIAQGPEHLDARDATMRGEGAVPIGGLGDLPLAVLTRTNGFDVPVSRVAGMENESVASARWRRDHWALAVEYAAASSRGVLISANASGHFIAFDQPNLVVSATLQVLAMARTAQ